MQKLQYIYSNKVWLDEKLQAATVVIEDKIIKEIQIEKRPKYLNVKNFGDNIIMPGVIDAHVHINEPGRTDWEGFNSATKAAARGGTTTLVDMPLNSSPVVTNLQAFKQKQEATKSQLHVNCGFWAGAIGQNPKEVIKLVNEGCLGIKVFLSNSGIDEFPKITKADLSLLMEAVKHLNVPVLAHCELDELPAANNLLKHPKSYYAYLKSRPATWEMEAIKLFADLALQHQCKAHIVHLATSEILSYLKKAKENCPLTVETCSHYILFNSEQIEDGETIYKCAPPIRNLQNNQGLINGLKTGVIDFISTDHSPAPPNLKELISGDFSKAWGGISGLQFLLAASWTALKSQLSVEDFIPLITEKPAQFLNLQNKIGTIAVNHQADLCIWSPDQSYIVTEDIIEHKHKATPYLNKKLFGHVAATYVNGICVFEAGAFKNLNQGAII